MDILLDIFNRIEEQVSFDVLDLLVEVFDGFFMIFNLSFHVFDLCMLFLDGLIEFYVLVFELDLVVNAVALFDLFY